MPEISVEITDKAFELLQEFKVGTGFNDDSQVIIEMFYSLKEAIDAYAQGNPRKVEGIISTFTRFNS